MCSFADVSCFAGGPTGGVACTREGLRGPVLQFGLVADTKQARQGTPFGRAAALIERFEFVPIKGGVRVWGATCGGSVRGTCRRREVLRHRWHRPQGLGALRVDRRAVFGADRPDVWGSVQPRAWRNPGTKLSIVHTVCAILAH